MMEEKIRICTPIHGEKFEQMYELFTKLITRFVPDATIIAHHYTPPGRYRCPAHGGDWGKAEATSIYTKDGPVFIMDVDAMLVSPIGWNPENKNAVLQISTDVDFTIVLPELRGLQVIQDVARYAGLLGPNEVGSANPQFFWATTNLLPLYEEMDSVFCEYCRVHGNDKIEFMWSLTVWTLVWLKLRGEGKTEVFHQPYPLWHCPMIGGDRLALYRIFADYMMKQPVESPEYPPSSLFGF